MRRALPEVHESLEALEGLLTRTKDAQRKRRVHLLVLIRSGQVHSRAAAAKHLRVHSIGDWLLAYEAGGLDGLLEIGKPGAKPGSEGARAGGADAPKQRLEGKGFDSYRQARQWLEREFDLQILYATVYGLVRFRLASKLKCARPQNVKKRCRRRRISPLAEAVP